MAKLVLSDINNSYASATKINSNHDLIEAALENTLSRDGTGPNNMLEDLDMDGNQIINVAEPTVSHHAVTKNYVDALALGGAVPIYDGTIIKDSYAELKAVTVPSADLTYIVKYRAALGDLGHGEFDWFPDSVEADNGGTILQRTAGGVGRFKRRINGPARSGWFLDPHATNTQTTALQAFLNCHPDLILDEGIHKSAAVTIPANTSLTGNRNSILLFNNTTGATTSGDPDNPHLIIGGDNVLITGITLDGSWTTETVAGGYGWKHYGIYNLGTSGAQRNDMVVRNCFIKNYGDSGIYTEFVNNKVIEDTEIERCGYSGTIGLSTDTGWITDCYIRNIFPGDSSENAYGIAETSSGSNRAASYITLENNRVDDVPSWEGVDIHFGKHCIVKGNIITNCSQGIAYENSKVGAPGDDIMIANNTIVGWSGATYTRDGRVHEKLAGIVCKGGAPNEYGTTLTIIGNNVTGMGDSRPGGTGAIFYTNWDGVVCMHNNVRDSYRSGISASYSGTAGIINHICSFNQIINVTAQGGICRGFDFLDLVEGVGVGNTVVGLSTGTEKFYQNPGSKLFKFVHPKETLQAARTYYVRSDGSNSNTGLANTSASAFLTIQGAIDHITANVDNGGYDVTISVPTGTWTTPIVAKSFEGNGKIIILGDTSTPSNVVISTTSSDCFTATEVHGTYSLRGLQFQTTTSGNGIWAAGSPTKVEFQSCNFAGIASAGHQISAFFGARVTATGNYNITGSAGTHLNAIQSEIDIRNRTVTLTGTPAYSIAFARAGRLSHIMASGASFSGSATGVRFSATYNGVIFTNNAGDTFLPGNAAGTTSTGGFYDSSSTDPENQIASTIVPSASSVSLTTATAASVATLSLGAGTWRVTGVVGFNPTGTTSITHLMVAVNTSVAMPSPELLASGRSQTVGAAFVPGANIQAVATGEAIFTFTSPTDVYLVTRAEFTVSTLTAFGKIQAQRIA